jgi:two-component system nitrogen regulation response regulator NtrX
MSKILLIDDEKEIRSTLSHALERRGHSVETAIDLSSARRKNIERFDVVLLDVFLPDGDGIDFLQELKDRDEAPPVIMISGHAGVEAAVKAIRIGAADFLEKPLSLDRVVVTITNTLQSDRLRRENRELSDMVFGRFIGSSPAMKEIRKNILTAAPKANRFLLLGENGTGKEMVARLVHENGAYRGGRFVAVNCAAIPSELVESELFGHVKGSFTGAITDKTGRFVEADGGSIFLDEIADMSSDAQAKILRVLEGGEVRPVGSSETLRVDLSVIAATNRDIKAMVDDKTFREDLYYRLNVVTIRIPPLRERERDIPALLDYYIRLFADRMSRPPLVISEDAMKVLKSYRYPGNVRELRNIAERMSIYTSGEEVTEQDVRRILPPDTTGPELPLKEALDGYEKEYIRGALLACNGNVSEAARRLNIERSHLYKKMKKLGLE